MTLLLPPLQAFMEAAQKSDFARAYVRLHKTLPVNRSTPKTRIRLQFTVGMSRVWVRWVWWPGCACAALCCCLRCAAQLHGVMVSSVLAAVRQPALYA